MPQNTKRPYCHVGIGLYNALELNMWHVIYKIILFSADAYFARNCWASNDSHFAHCRIEAMWRWGKLAFVSLTVTSLHNWGMLNSREIIGMQCKVSALSYYVSMLYFANRIPDVTQPVSNWVLMCAVSHDIVSAIWFDLSCLLMWYYIQVLIEATWYTYRNSSITFTLPDPRDTSIRKRLKLKTNISDKTRNKGVYFYVKSKAKATTTLFMKLYLIRGNSFEDNRPVGSICSHPIVKRAAMTLADAYIDV